MNTTEFADLLACRSNLPADALEALAEYAEIGIYDLNLRTGEIGLNHMITKLTGYEPGELPHNENTKAMLTFEDDLDIVNGAMAGLMSGETGRYYIEYRMKRRDGSLVSIGENGLVIERDENGMPTRICAMAHDLSRLRWAEDKARRMERENRLIAGTVKKSDLIERNRMLRATNAAASMIIGGYHQKYETVLRQALQIIAESIDADKAYIMRNTLVDGEMVFFIRAIWDKDSSPEPGGPESGWLYDEIFPGWREDFREHFSLRSTVEDLKETVGDLPWVSNAISIMLAPIYLQGEFWGMLGFENRTDGHVLTEDETDVTLAGSLVVASSISRNEVFQKLNKAKDEAMASTKAKGEFLSRMSHEIRTPINAIIGMSTLAKKNGDPESIKYYLDMIDSSSRQLLSLINDILDMSKIESGKLEIVNEPFNVCEILNSVLDVIRVKCDEKGQKLVVNAGVDFSRTIIGDSLRLSQVLINLLSNAAKFTPEGGTVTLTILGKKLVYETPLGGRRAKPMLNVSVADTGIGISEEAQKNLFQAFEQADGSITRDYGGSGLGLSICKSIVELMGGEIGVTSTEGEGSVFTFEIPIEWGEAVSAGNGDDANAEAREKIAFIGSEAPDWSGRRILLAEDIDINREIVIGLLEDTGVEIVPAGDGKEALDLFENDPESFDLIIMDMQMPRMDGLTATTKIRALENLHAKTVPIIAITANAFKEDVERCLEAGMDAHLAKPLDINLLINTVARYLRK